MPLTYRAMLVPTAAIDSVGNAKPNATFTVTPLAGGSPVDVYASAEGGTALSASAVKSDAAGNISGFYVTDPGAYTLAFAGGVAVVTSATEDPRSHAQVFTETPVETWVPFIYAPDTEPHVVSGDEIIPDPALADGWIDGEDLYIDPTTGRVTVRTAGLYLVQVQTRETVYSSMPGGAEATTTSVYDTQGGYYVINLGLFSPDGSWGCTVQDGGDVRTYNGELKLTETLYLPAGTKFVLTVNLLNPTKDFTQDGQMAPVEVTLTNLALQVTRFAPAAA